MATFRDILNRVLVVLAEDEVDDLVTELSTDYHKLVAAFVNHIKEEVEDAHNWRSLLTNTTATVLAGASSGAIAGANERSRLWRYADQRNGQYVPIVFDTTDSSNPVPLQEMDLALQRFMDVDDTSTQSGAPSFFAINFDAASGSMNLLVYPTPSTTRTFSVSMIIPQDRLENDDLDVVIKVPSRVVELGSIWFALHERGEDLGVNSLFTEERFRNALDDAVARDAEEQGGYNLVVV
jgi:hypothetical protein